jgi:hypothetical protein
MSQDIAAVIMIFAATILPVAISLSTKWRRRRPAAVKASRSIRNRTGYTPRHLSTGRRTAAAAAAAGPDRPRQLAWAAAGLPR